MSNEDLEQFWYFTFGYNHQYSNNYVKIHGDYISARNLMFERFGTKWSMQYESAEDAGIDEYGLTELTVE